MAQPVVERAAGGVVIRHVNGRRQVLLIDDQYGKVAFPKGHVEPGETWEVAAVREVSEETGIQARIISPLGRVEYRIDRDGKPVRKQVRLFLMEALEVDAQPVPQLEELPAAYYVDWDAAVSLVHNQGYDNWKWLLGRADIEYRWRRSEAVQAFQQLNLDAPFDELLAKWSAVQPLAMTMRSAIREELAACVPEWQRRFPRGLTLDEASDSWPIQITDEETAILEAVEHTLLRPDASGLDVLRVTHEAVHHRFKAVCVNPQHVAAVSQAVAGTDTLVCTVVGFPLGAANSRALQTETEAAISAGAHDIDMVLPIGSMAEDDIWSVYQHVAAVVEEAHLTPGTQVKVILETHYLTKAQVMKACMVAVAAGADFVKTSTGFAPSGATLTDVLLMLMSVGDAAGVKAAGGIRTRTAAVNLLRVGVGRIGTSNGISIANTSTRGH